MSSTDPTLATVIAQPLTSPLVIVPSVGFDFSESIDRMRIPKNRAVTFAGVGFCILEELKWIKNLLMLSNHTFI